MIKALEQLAKVDVGSADSFDRCLSHCLVLCMLESFRGLRQHGLGMLTQNQGNVLIVGIEGILQVYVGEVQCLLR